MIRRLTVLALLLTACKPSPRHGAPTAGPEHAASEPPPVVVPPDAAAAPDLGQVLAVDPALAPQLTHRVDVPGTPWFALTPASWQCKSEAARELTCEAAKDSRTRVEWHYQAAPGSGTVADRIAHLVAEPGQPVSEHRRVHSGGAAGTFMRTRCMKAQCLDPILTLWEGDPVMQLDVLGDCDRTDCDAALTIAVMSSTRR